MTALAPSTKYMHTYRVIACRYRRSPHCQRFKVAMWLALSSIQSGQFPVLQRHDNAQLVTTSEPANTIIKAQGLPRARSRGVRQLGGRLESNLTGCACRPETYTTRLIPAAPHSVAGVDSLGAGRMTSTKICQPGGAVSATRARHLSTGSQGLGRGRVGRVGPPLHLLLPQRSMPARKHSMVFDHIEETWLWGNGHDCLFVSHWLAMNSS